jgi:hypothetical protein
VEEARQAWRQMKAELDARVVGASPGEFETVK